MLILIILLGVIFFTVYMIYKINVRIKTGYKYWQFLIPIYNIGLICDMGNQKRSRFYIPFFTCCGLWVFLETNKGIGPEFQIIVGTFVVMADVIALFIISMAWGIIAEKLGKDKGLFFLLTFIASILNIIKDIDYLLQLNLLQHNPMVIGTFLLFIIISTLAYSKNPNELESTS